MRKIPALVVGGAMLSSAASLTIAPAAGAKAQTLHLTGVVVGKDAKERHNDPKGVAGPKRVDLMKHGKAVGSLSFTAINRQVANPGCTVSLFLTCDATLRLKALHDVSAISLTFGSFVHPSPNSPGGGQLTDLSNNLDVGTITVNTGFKNFTSPHARFPVVIKLNKFAK